MHILKLVSSAIPLRPSFRAQRFVAYLAALVGAACGRGTPASHFSSALALVGGTVIDGNGGPPLADATVVVVNGRITAIGPRRAVAIPAGAQHLDMRGKYLTPGFVDANVHLTPFVSAKTDTPDWEQRYAVQALRIAERALADGVTTLRDTYGYLPSLLIARDSLRRGTTLGSRLLVAGPVLGWGGPGSATQFGVAVNISDGTDEHYVKGLLQGVGEDLPSLPPQEMRARLMTFLDKGVDFIKIGVTYHTDSRPTFSPEALKMIVDETHRRGLGVDVHAGGIPAIRRAVMAGVDVVQHASGSMLETLDDSTTDAMKNPEARDLIELLAKQRVVTTVNMPTRQRDKLIARSLVRGGVIVALATDRSAQEYLTGLESMVTDVGMTPNEVIVAATRNGALAAKAIDHYGTLEVGKAADLLVFSADPLADIHNVRTLEHVVFGGHLVR